MLCTVNKHHTHPNPKAMIAPIPTELVSLLGSSLLGGIMKLHALSAEAKRRERLLTLQALNARFEHIEKARAFQNRGFQWTRRVIALSAVFSVIVLPKLVAVFAPDIPIQIGYPQLETGTFFWSMDTERLTWVQLSGIVITPLDTHLLSAIVGLYFGGSLAGHHRF
jgi:hypothetical protein